MGGILALQWCWKPQEYWNIPKGLQCRCKAKRPPPFGPSFGVDLTRKKEFCDAHITKSLFSRHILAKTSVTLR